MCLFPKESYQSTYIIPFEDLLKRGVRGVLFDIDNTLITHGAPANSGAIKLFEKLHGMGLKTCLISNNGSKRVRPFADAVDTPFISNAHKPLKSGYIKGCEVMGLKPSDVVFVGDQIFTDILGANFAKVHSILVEPIYDDPEFQIKLKRLLEVPVLFLYRLIKKKGPKKKGPMYLIIGNPLGHTKSPELHCTLNYQNGMIASYKKKEVHNSLKKALDRLHGKKVMGMSVTMPFKQEIMPFLSHIDEEALAAGAVNTLVWHEEGYHGFNTDIPGLYKCLEKGGMDIGGKDVLLLGAGGAAGAAAMVCLKKSVSSLTIINRTREKAQDLSDKLKALGAAFPITVLTYNECDKADKDSYMAIQCTGLGMNDTIGQLPPLSEDLYRKISSACDAIYNPPETAFLQKVRENGGKTVNGYDMFYWQAIAARKLWNLPSGKDEEEQL